MFERFTVRSRKVVVPALDEARRYDQHGHAGTGRLLLVLVLAESGGPWLRPDGARERVDITVGHGEEGGGVPFTPLLTKAFGLVPKELLQSGHDHAGSLYTGAVYEENVRRLSEVGPVHEPQERIEPETERRRLVRSKGRVIGIESEEVVPDGGSLGGKLPLLGDPDYEYDVAQKGLDGFETTNIPHVGDLVQGEIPPAKAVTATATRGDSPSATFRR